MIYKNNSNHFSKGRYKSEFSNCNFQIVIKKQNFNSIL
jgi:hypothetical protein